MLREGNISKRSRIRSLGERETRDKEKVSATISGVQHECQEVASNLSSAQRADNAAQAIHSSNMEGVEVSQPVVMETYDYISGKISASTLVARVKAIHGLE